jgi:hypothetical protein
MKLSILIPTVVGREDSLDGLMSILNRQITNDVEIVIEKDNKEISIGAKRNLLYSKANGVYSVSIDDDDTVPEYFIQKILEKIDGFQGVDCIGYQERCYWDGSRETLSDFSLRYNTWKEQKDNEFRFVRTPFHKTPILTGIARDVKFQDRRFGEDHIWSKEIYERLKTEVYIPHVMYNYHYTQQDHKTKYGIK